MGLRLLMTVLVRMRRHYFQEITRKLEEQCGGSMHLTTDHVLYALTSGVIIQNVAGMKTPDTSTRKHLSVLARIRLIRLLTQA